MDIFYIDESHDNNLYVVTAIALPFLRLNEDAAWWFEWQDVYNHARVWRRQISKRHKIPEEKELHGAKLAAGAGHFHYGQRNFTRGEAASVYRDILSTIPFIRDASIMSVAGGKGMQLYGNDRLTMVMYALFQRMRLQCESRRVNAMTFFDQGHPEYRKLYRQAQVHFPTGSNRGSWSGGGASTNLPLDMFVKDGNFKESKHCLFTQIADLIAYAAFLKVKAERKDLEPWQAELSLDRLYDALPLRLINQRVSNKQPRDGIVRLWLYEKRDGRV